MDNNVIDMNEIDKLKKQLNISISRINSALSTINAEQERLTVILNSLNYKKELDIRQIAYTILSNKVSIEMIRSELKGDAANYNFEDVTYKDKGKKIEDEQEKAFKERELKRGI